MKKILIVEDDKHLNKALSISFEDEFRTESAFTLKEALEKEGDWDLILLDLNLPDGDGLDFLKSSKRPENTPVIVLSARDMETDIIAAIRLGADDMMTKPFSLGILKAKVHRLLTRFESSAQNIYKNEWFDFRFDTHLFYVDGQEISLSLTERKLLYILISAKGAVVSREMMLEKIWGLDEEWIDENTVNVNINRLRNKLKPHDPIVTVYGVGYKWTC